MASRIRQGVHVASRPRPVRVLVDMDGVMCDFDAHFLKTYREKHPELPYIPLEERRTLYLADQYIKFGEEIRAKVKEIVDAPGFFRHLPPIPGAVDAVKELSGMDGVEVSFCTSQSRDSNFSATDKLDWITEHLGQDWTQRAIITHDKTLVQGDFLIDDNPNIKGSVRKPTWRQIMYSCCHNLHFDIRERPNIMARMDSWAELDKLKEYIEECKKSLA